MKKMKYKIGLIIGISLVIIGILIGIILNNDIGFIFAGLGTATIGISTLAYINRNNN